MSITYYSIVKIFFTPTSAVIASCSSAATSHGRFWSMLVASTQPAIKTHPAAGDEIAVRNCEKNNEC